MSRRSRPAAARAGNHGLEQRLFRAWREIERAVPSGPIVLGFSGGPDSLALAIALGQIAPLVRRVITLLHVDHGLRPESSAEAEAAVGLAAALELPIQIERIVPERLQRHRGVGREEQARRERYVITQRVTTEFGGVFVTAHHADDQAETVLLHLLRGSGLDGVGGMRPLTHLAVPWWASDENVSGVALPVWRPLLAQRRATLAAYRCERRPDLVPTEDASNADHTLRRNATRATLLPEMERLFPGAADALARFAALARADADLLDDLAAEAVRSVMIPDGSIDIARLRSAPPALRRRVLRRWVLHEQPAIEMPSERVESVLRLAEEAEGGKAVEIGQGVRIVRSGRLLRLERERTPGPGGATLRPSCR